MGNMLGGKPHKTDGGVMYSETTKSVKLKKKSVSRSRRDKDAEVMEDGRPATPPPTESKGQDSFCKMGKLRHPLSDKGSFNHRKKSWLSNLRNEFSRGPRVTFGKLNDKLGN